MTELNHDIPPTELLIRERFLYAGDESKTGHIPAIAHSVCAIPGQALTFHTQISGNGANYWRLPIHALCTKPGAPDRSLSDLELWDCPSHNLTVFECDWLAGSRMLAVLRDKTRALGNYLFTVDFWGTPESEGAGDIGWKCMHVIELDEGNLAALPNNRVLSASPSHVAKPFETVPDYLIQQQTWKCEGTSKWDTGDEPRMFYGVEGS